MNHYLDKVQRVFIGYDSTQDIAYHVLKHSILKHATKPTWIVPIILKDLPWFNRPYDPLQSTEFTYTRFLVPYLCRFSGPALFMDSDMLCLSDISELFSLYRKTSHAIFVRKHDHQPVETVKMRNKIQTSYPRKNWSSLMLMDCSQLECWTRENVETKPAKWLHRFEPLEDYRIGDISEEWNVLDKMDSDTKLIHYTSGGPWLQPHPFGYIWFQYKEMYEKEAAVRNYQAS